MMEKFLKLKRKSSYLVFAVLLALMLFFVVGILNAQTWGEIVGKVTDAKTGENLMGANVMLKGTSYGTATDRWGNYRISHIPFGTYTLVATYIGYEKYTAEVTLSIKKRIVRHDFVMKISAVKMKAVVVQGLREGQIKALNRQRTAVDIRNVVAREQMERFPDYNTAEVLKRLPGVAVDRALGQARYVLIRGTEPRLSQVTIDGQALASTRRKERYSQLDVISSNQMASVEVIKALTPDMDANAIGGIVNIIPRSPFDYEGRRLIFSGGGGYVDLSGKPLYQGKLSYSDRFGAKKNIGVAITASLDRADKAETTTKYKIGEEKDVSGNVIPFALQDFRLQPGRFRDTRYGLALDVEYRVNENSRFFIRGAYNRFDNLGLSSSYYRIRVNKGDYLDATHVTDARLVRSSKSRLEAITQNSYSAGGVHQFGNLGVDYTVTYNYGEEKHPDELLTDWDFADKVDLTLDLSDPVSPKWNITNMDDNLQYDPTLYTLSGVEYLFTDATNRNIISSMNFKLPYSLGGFPSNLKFGTKVTLNHKDYIVDDWKYKWKGEGDIILDKFVSGGGATNFAEGHYKVGPLPDRDKIYDFCNAQRDKGLQGAKDLNKSLGSFFDANENIYAFYGMTSVHFGRLMFLGGVRYEYAKTNYEANRLFYDDEGNVSSWDKVKDKGSYGKLLPMVHLRYSPSKMTNLRVAVTRSISRPDYAQLAPYIKIDPSEQTISKGNTTLVPTTATNVDIMTEHYFRGIGVASAGFFYKKLNDIIISQFEQLAGGLYDGYWQSQPINGGEASLYGFELNWHQELTFLPGFLSGFGIYANYTHTWAKTELTGREGFLPGQAGDIGNIALSYEKGGFSAQLSFNFQGRFIRKIGMDAAHDQYVDNYRQIDFSATQKLSSSMSAFFEMFNTNNAPQYWYLGETSRPIVKRIFSWLMRAGLKLTL